MRACCYKIVSFVMALIVLFSTFSFTMNSHYCGDYLVDSAWFVDADSCGMSVAKDQHSHEKSIMKDGCCNDVTWTIDGQDDLKITFEDLTHEQQLFVVSFIYSYINLFEGLETKNNGFGDYSPPPLIKDVQVLHQTFLI
ncbi:MAG: hypothetical protein CMH48_15360 [Muricauda sp.]|nr:hypothetical protein [Allomuricauda sp.]